MVPYYQYKLLDPSECQAYVDYFNDFHNIIDVQWNFPTNERKHTMIQIDTDHELHKKVDTRLKKLHEEITDMLGIPYTPKSRIFNIFINRYAEGEFVNWHLDRFQYQRNDMDIKQPTNPRLYNISVNLNTEYTGGELLLRNKTVVPVPTREIGVSTSFAMKTPHKVNKIKSGARYSLVTWVYDDNDPSYYDDVPTDWKVGDEWEAYK